MRTNYPLREAAVEAAANAMSFLDRKLPRNLCRETGVVRATLHAKSGEEPSCSPTGWNDHLAASPQVIVMIGFRP